MPGTQLSPYSASSCFPSSDATPGLLSSPYHRLTHLTVASMGIFFFVPLILVGIIVVLLLVDGLLLLVWVVSLWLLALGLLLFLDLLLLLRSRRAAKAKGQSGDLAFIQLGTITCDGKRKGGTCRTKACCAASCCCQNMCCICKAWAGACCA